MNINPTDAIFIQAIIVIFMVGMCLQRLIFIERELKDFKNQKYPERIAKLETELGILKTRGR